MKKETRTAPARTLSLFISRLYAKAGMEPARFEAETARVSEAVETFIRSGKYVLVAGGLAAMCWQSLQNEGKAAEKTCTAGSTIHHMPFPVIPQMVYEAMLKADKIGRRYKMAGDLKRNEV